MQTHLKGRQSWLGLGILVLTLTACSTTVTRGPLETPDDLSGRWNDTDSRLTAEALIKAALDRPWSQRFTQVMGRRPVVVVGTVLNRTHEPLNTQTFEKDLERALGEPAQERVGRGLIPRAPRGRPGIVVDAGIGPVDHPEVAPAGRIVRGSKAD